jgi:hypothetical protein
VTPALRFLSGERCATVSFDTTFHHLEHHLEINSEKILSGSARLLGLHIYRQNDITEIEIGLWWRMIYLSFR